MTDREALRQRLLATFQVEAREHVASLSSALMDLERAAPGEAPAALIETAFRVAHSLKGASRAVGLAQIETVCQAMESVFAALKRGSLELTAARVDALLRATRVLEALRRAADGGEADPDLPVASVLRGLSTALEGRRPAMAESPLIAQAESPPIAQAESPRAPPRVELPRAVDTVRVPTDKLDAVRREAEELLAERVAATEQAAELDKLRAELSSQRKQALRASRELDGGKARIHDFLDANQRLLEEIDHRVVKLAREARRHERGLASKLDALLWNAKQLLMLPCSWLLDGLRQVVRDLSHDQGKEVELAISGESIEIDRRILTELKDPVLHILRNAIDHGLEPPAERERAGKSRRARIAISLTQLSGNRVEMTIADDGRGLDTDRLAAAAARLGLIEEADARPLGPEAIANLAFASELSTSPLITDLSGRGLGLAIVREKVERLGGVASIESRPGAGASVRMVLPLSLATFRGVIVRVQDRFWVLPTDHVKRVLRVPRAAIRSVENRAAIEVDGRAVAFAPLGGVLGLPAANESEDRAFVQALLLEAGALCMAFAVDEVCDEEDVLLRNLGPLLTELRSVMGATVLGSGSVAVILDPSDLLRRAVEASESGALVSGPQRRREPPRKHSVLIAEDSITSRTLLKTILESAGFSVTTAVDGVDAFTKLQSERFDLLVSDVDMPRLNGLGLTAKVRAHPKLAELPVVLVTSLESREDRERGIEVGANAYIVKQSFEQSNLLEVIQRLL